MRIAARVHDSLKERNTVIEEDLKNAPPGFVVSCPDGIVMLAFKNKNSRVLKIKRLLDRVAFMGAGDPSDYNGKVYEPIALFAKISAHVDYSPGDLRVVEKIKSHATSFIRSHYRDLWSHEYLTCEIVIAVLGMEHGQDELCRIDFKGQDGYSSSGLVIPTLKKDMVTPEFFSTNDGDMRSALRSLARFVSGNSGLVIEAAVLEREAAVRKSFEGVYRKLTSEELSRWIR